MDKLAAHNDLVSIADVVGQMPETRQSEILAAVQWLTFLGVIQPRVPDGLTTTRVSTIAHEIEQ
jgi:hypothetical protein